MYNINIPENYEFCILFITWQLTINCWLTIRKTLVKYCLHKKWKSKNLKKNHDHAPLFHIEFLRLFSTSFGVIFIKWARLDSVFLHKVGSDCALDALPTDGALGEGGGTLRTGDKVTAGQEHNGHLLVQADFTDGQVLQFFVFLFQHARISCTDRHYNVRLVTTASYKITCKCWVIYDQLWSAASTYSNVQPSIVRYYSFS